MISKEDKIQEIIESLSRLHRPAPASAGHRPIEHGAWRALGLSHAQIGMLYMLYCHENASFKQIAKYLDVSNSAITQLVEPLLDKGLVLRQVDPKDRRSAKLTLSPKGKDLLKKFKKQKTEGLRTALNGLNSNDLTHFTRICQKMSAPATRKNTK